MDALRGIVAAARRGGPWSLAPAVALVAWLLCASAAAAQSAPLGPVVISSSSGTPLVISGLASDKLPVGVSIGTEACIPSRRVYTSEGERWIFQKWSDGSTDDCITPDKAGEFRALYSHEVLLIVNSPVADTQRSTWVPYGVPVSLDVPPIVPDGDVDRYRFQSWSGGETPFDHANTIAPLKPTNLEVKWVREHQVTIEQPDGAGIQGSGWYADGSNLVLRAPDTLPGGGDQERFKFQGWQSDSYPAAVIQNPQTPLAALKIDAAYTVRAAYLKQYLVNADSPLGNLKHDWVNDGDTVVLEAPATSDVVPDQERLVFKRWDGMDGLLSPKIAGKVDKPISVSAVYERQVMLKVDAPRGASGDGWQKVGNVANVSVPGSYSDSPLLQSTFTNFGGYPVGQSAVQVLVNEPTTLTALYRTEPNLIVLALLLCLPLLAVLVYLGVVRGWFVDWKLRAGARLGRFRRKPAVSPQEQQSLQLAELPGRNGTHLPLPIGEEKRN
jgi:hypothetical protein